MLYKKLELQDFSNLNADLTDQAQENPDFDSQIAPEIQDVLSEPEIEPEIDKKLVDIEEIKAQAYEEGYASCKIELQKVIDSLSENKSLHELLKLKLLEISSFEGEEKYKEQLINLLVSIITKLGKKLHLSIPVDFNLILQEKILSILKQHYKDGFIKITSHPSKTGIITEFMQLEQFGLGDDKAKNFSIISDESFEANDCILEWNSNRFEFQISEVTKEIDSILEQFEKLIKQK
jgi:hypothetical protein